MGALGGKHVAIRKPAKSSSLYYNYKGFFCVVLMALVDGDYKFLWVDISGYGSTSDAEIFNDSELKECLEDKSIGFPELSPTYEHDEPVPHSILGDDAFGIRIFLIRTSRLPWQHAVMSTRQILCRTEDVQKSMHGGVITTSMTRLRLGTS